MRSLTNLQFESPTIQIVLTAKGQTPENILKDFKPHYKNNKTSIQLTPGSQICRSNQKIIFVKNDF